MSHMGFRLVLE